MFNNPLRKYQSGGTTPSPEQQQLLMAFVEWLPKRVKEFANMAPEQIVETLNGMSQSPEGQKQVEQLMQQFKQEFSGAQPSQFAKGGKLHNFICKHAKGGYLAGCGCNEKGGKVRSAQNGTSGIPQNSAALDMYLMNNMQMPNSGNLFTGQQVASIINGMHLNQPLVQAQEDGGKVEVAQKGKLLQDGNYTVQVNAPGDTTRTIYNKYNRQIMQTYPDGSVRYTTMSNNGNDDYQVNTWTGRPSWTKRIWFGNKRATPEKVNAWNEEIASRAIDPRNIVSKEEGGAIKNKEPENPGGTLKQGKPRGTISRIIDNNPKMRHFVEGTQRFVKSPMFKVPAAGAAAYLGYQFAGIPFIQETGEAAPFLAKGLFPILTQLRPKFVLDTMNPDKDGTKAKKFSDVFWVADRTKSQENGGVIKGQGGLAKVGKAVVNTAKSARKTGTYVPEQAIGKPFFGNAVRFSKSISPERYRAVINWRLANDPNYKLSLDSMERAMQSMGNADIAYDLYRLKNFGATNKAEFLQFEDMMNRGLTGNQVINSLKARPGNNGIFPLSLDPGHYAKEAEQMVFHPYVSGIGNFKQGGVVKGQEGLNIPAEPPTGYNGEIRQYIDRRNPIRRRIDTFVENNPYARKIVSLGKGIKESPLGMLLPDFSNGVAGAVAPAGKISNLGKSLSRAEQAAIDASYAKYSKHMDDFDPSAARLPKSAFEKYWRPADEGEDLVKVLDYEIPTNYQGIDLNSLTKPTVWDRIGSAVEASPWIGIPAVTAAAIYKSEKDKKKKEQEQQLQNK